MPLALMIIICCQLKQASGREGMVVTNRLRVTPKSIGERAFLTAAWRSPHDAAAVELSSMKARLHFFGADRVEGVPHSGMRPMTVFAIGRFGEKCSDTPIA